jgi:4-amino-4-deoxy-L-arabinose transferase-like glycosyltransferase
MTRISRFAAWFGFTGVFLLAGLTGHDPWKQDETYSFGIIYHFYVTHSWLVPVNAGMPFMEKPPLYYWTAALCCRLFGGLLPLHDAARLADFFYMAVATVFMGMSAGVLFRNSPRQKEMIWAVPALFLGTLGVVRHAHDLFTDVALLAGSSVALYGMALLVLNDNRVKAGMWLGVGMGMAFLSKGLLTPAIFGLALFFLLLVRKEMRGGGTAQALILAALAASSFSGTFRGMVLGQQCRAVPGVLSGAPRRRQPTGVYPLFRALVRFSGVSPGDSCRCAKISSLEAAGIRAACRRFGSGDGAAFAVGFGAGFVSAASYPCFHTVCRARAGGRSWRIHAALEHGGAFLFRRRHSGSVDNPAGVTAIAPLAADIAFHRPVSAGELCSGL